MAGLRINDQKNAIAVTMTTVTAFKICISHRKNGFLNYPNTQVNFPAFLVDFAWAMCRKVTSPRPIKNVCVNNLLIT